jgi:hypothetical protein
MIRRLLEVLGPISWLLGLAIVRNRAKRTLSVSQESVPINSDVRLISDDCPSTDDEKTKMKGVPFRELVGALNWLAVGTRPDIAFIVGQLAQFLQNPGRVHWEGRE